MEKFERWDSVLNSYENAICRLEGYVEENPQLLVELWQAIRRRITMLLELKQWDAVAKDLVRVLAYAVPFPDKTSPEMPLVREFTDIINRLRALPDNERAQVYTALGAWATAVRNAEEGREFAQAFAEVRVKQGVEQERLGRLSSALTHYRDAVIIYRDLVATKGRREFAHDLAVAVACVGVTLWQMRRRSDALTCLDESVAMLTQLVATEGHLEYAEDLATSLMNKGVVLNQLHCIPDAVACYDSALAFYKVWATHSRLITTEDGDTFADHLATVLLNKALALGEVEQWSDALACYDEALVYYKQRMEAQGRSELTDDLAAVLVNRGVALAELDMLPDALACYDEALTYYERLGAKHADKLATALTNKGNALVKMGLLPDALACYDDAVAVWEHLVEIVDPSAFVEGLQGTLTNRQIAFEKWNAGRGLWHRLALFIDSCVNRSILALMKCVLCIGPASLVHTVGQLCVSITMVVGRDNLAGYVHFHVADLLDQRYDQHSLEIAAQYYQRARQQLAPQDPVYSATYLNEAVVRERLAVEGHEPVRNLLIAVTLLKHTRQHCVAGSAKYGETLQIEGHARMLLVEWGVEPLENLIQAKTLYEDTRQCYAPNSLEYPYAQMGEAGARRELANLGVESVTNLQAAMMLCAQARQCFTPGSPEYTYAQQCETRLQSQLVELGITPVERLEQGGARYVQGPQEEALVNVENGQALLHEGTVRLDLAQQNIDAEVNLRAARTLYTQARQYLAPDSPDYGGAQMNEGTVRLELTGQGIEPTANLQQTIRLYTQARQCFAPDSPAYNGTLAQESRARYELAALGVEPQTNLQTAAVLYTQLRQRVAPDSEIYVWSQACEGHVRLELAEWGIEPEANLEQTRALYAQALRGFAPDSPEYGEVLGNVGIARRLLAERGIKPVTNLRAAVRLCVRARRRFPPDSVKYGKTQTNEGAARLRLAEWGIEPVANLQATVTLCAQARQCFASPSPSYGKTLMNEGYARHCLAEWGIEPEANLRAAVTLAAQALPHFAPSSPEYGSAQANEGYARLRLAEREVEPEVHLLAAVALYVQARERFIPSSSEYGRALLCEGATRFKLAEQEIEPEANLRAAVTLWVQARQSFAPKSPEYGRTLLHEGSARGGLIERGLEPPKTWGAVMALYEQAMATFDKGSPDWMRAQWNYAHALRLQGLPLEAYECLKAGLDVVENLRAQMQRESERIAFLETIAGQYAEIVEVCLELAARAPFSERAEAWRWEAWHWVHRSKSRALLELLANVRPYLTDDDIPLWAAFESRAHVLDEREREVSRLRWFLGKADDALRASLPPEAVAETTARLATVIAAWREAQQAYMHKRQEVLQHIDSARPLLTVDVPPPREVARQLRTLAGLAEDATRRPLLVEYFTLSDAELAVFLVPLWEERPPVVQRVPVARGTVRRMALALQEAVATLQPETRAGHREETAPVGAATRAAAHARLQQQLGELGTLVAPWADALAQTPWWPPTELVLAPHGLLNLLPLHAALWQDKPLIEHCAVVYLPAPALAAEITKQRKPLSGKALVLGDPRTDLEGAKAEGRLVATRLAARGLPAHLFTGTDATTACVAAHAPTAGLLHWACHATLDRVDFLRSGLELADRRLTVLDLMARLELAKAVLVYVSSCDSGQMLVGRTDELLALVRAFLYAGSPTVLATLWALDDAVGPHFATHFYKHWVSEGQPLARAFQQAMVATRQRYKQQPFYWAPFVLLGAWR